MSLSGKSIVITGAASGIGRATSLLSASQGASVLVVDYAENIADTAAVINAKGGKAAAVQADVRSEEDVRGCIEQCIEKFGGIDGIFANAGIGGARKPFSKLTPQDWQQTLAINTIGTFLCIKHAAVHFMTQNAGSIVCTASTGGLRANAGGVDYSASKAAVISMIQTVAYELYGTGVRINAICPGLVETGMTAATFTRAREKGNEGRIGQLNPMARPGEAAEIAEMACFLLSDAASYVNGQAIPVDGGLSASHPWIFPRNPVGGKT